MNFRSQKKAAQDVSIMDPIDVDGEGNPLTLMDIIAVDDTISDDLDTKIKTEKLYRCIAQMRDSREKNILVLRYGLFGVLPHTQKQVAERMGISRSYVSRIEKRLLEKMRRRLER
jgi:RNA polymerase sporulation-specific sigma factor